MWSDVKVYYGTYKADKRHGEGIYRWPNGDCFVGMYENDKRHGAGTYISKSGQHSQGTYDQGQKHGVCFNFSTGFEAVDIEMWAHDEKQEGTEDAENYDLEEQKSIFNENLAKTQSLDDKIAALKENMKEIMISHLGRQKDKKVEDGEDRYTLR